MVNDLMTFLAPHQLLTETLYIMLFFFRNPSNDVSMKYGCLCPQVVRSYSFMKEIK